jgi:hypothetical protein
MYFVKDTANLGNANGYELFAAGRAASIDWANIENVPTLSLTGDATGSVNLTGITTNGKIIEVTVADDSHEHTHLTSGATYLSDLTKAFAPNNTLKLYTRVSKETPGLFSTSTNANAILAIAKHDTNYSSQLGFSANGSIYYRDFNAKAIDATTAWKKLAFTSDNVASADKWSTARTITLTGDVTGETTIDGSGDISFDATVGDDTHNHTPKTITLSGYSKAGSVDAFSRQMINTARSNKTFHLPAEAIVVEYSQDGGSTWLDYAASDANKIGLFSETRVANFKLGKDGTKGAQTTDWQLRVTITPTDRYTTFDAFYAWFCTQGNTCVCDLYRSTIGEPDNFKTIATDKKLSGWSGNNIIYFSGGQFGGSES